MKWESYKLWRWAWLISLLMISSCQQKQSKQHLIISEGIEQLRSNGLQTDLFLRPNDYQLACTCLFDGRMSYENLQLELSLHNQQNTLLRRDTLDFQLAKRKGTWTDSQPLVHEAKAQKPLFYKIPFTAIYHFKFRLLNKTSPEGILGLSLEIIEEQKAEQ